MLREWIAWLNSVARSTTLVGVAMFVLLPIVQYFGIGSNFTIVDVIEIIVYSSVVYLITIPFCGRKNVN